MTPTLSNPRGTPYAMYPASTPDAEIAAAFARKRGYQAAEIFRVGPSAYAGPVKQEANG